MSNIVKHQSGGTVSVWNSQEENVIRTELFPGLNDGQFAVFAEVCKHTGLSPFKREIYATVRGGKLTVQTGIDTFRKHAAADPNYNGQTQPQWCGEDGVWKDIWTGTQPPFAARIGVYRKGAEHPTWGVAHYSEYMQTKSGGGANQMWQNMPRNQLAKCAESLALRKALPERLGGIYTTDEMVQAEVAAPEYLSDEQVEELVTLAVRGGKDKDRAKAHYLQCRADQYDRKKAAILKLVDEVEQVVEADAVEVEA